MKHWPFEVSPLPVKSLPAEQSWQAMEDEAPTVAENLPGPQKMHTADETDPRLVENMLAGQP